jgi:hypothetical protein
LETCQLWNKISWEERKIKGRKKRLERIRKERKKERKKDFLGFSL